MMHSVPFIQDLAVILGVAGLVTLLFRKIHQPVVLGYVLAGMILGPYTPPFPLVKDVASIQVWSDLGVIFLMFALGLEFTFHKLSRVGRAATGTAVVEVIGMVGIGLLTGRFLGWSLMDSVFLGGMLSISSTTIIIKALDELKLKSRHFAEVVFGVLIVEDLVAILLLVALSTVALTHSFFSWALLSAALQLFFIVGSWFVVGYFLIPSFLRYAAKHLDDETLTVLGAAFCLILASVATHFHYSAALGAFIMGSILAETREAERIDQLTTPLKNIFAAVFFVSVGMLVNPKVLFDQWRAIAVLSLVTIVGKMMISALGALLSGQSIRNAVRIGFSLAQIGEFSFIIAALGTSLKVTNPVLYPVAVAVSVITTFTTPFLIQLSEPAGAWIEARLPPKIRNALAHYHESARRGESVAHGRRPRVYLWKLVINAIAAGLVFALVSKVILPYGMENFPQISLLPSVGWAMALAFSAPFTWGMLHSFASRLEEKPSLIQIIFESLLTGLVTFIWLSLISALFFEMTASLLVSVVVLGLIFIAFYRRFEISYRWFESTFTTNLALGTSHREEQALETTLAPWDLHLIRVVVHPNSEIVGKTLRQLEIRNRFGINVVALQRGSKTIVPPGASDVALPGDLLLLLGNDEQVDPFVAQASLPLTQENESRPLADYSLKKMVIDSGSPFIGKSLRDLGLREKLGTLVVGLERRGKQELNPAGDSTLEAGDLLWVVK